MCSRTAAYGAKGIAVSLFLHWFPKFSKPRIYYAAGLRLLGFGNFTEGKSTLHWSRDFCEWLDNWTHYRTRQVIHHSFSHLIGETTHAEEEWLSARYGGRFDALPS